MTTPYELLERLCVAHTHLTFDAQQDIERLVVLKAAEMIEADIPPVFHDGRCYRYVAHAVVMRVTALGHTAMNEHRAEVAH